MCEDVLDEEREPGFTTRHPAAGHGLRLLAAAAPRPDVNILTNHAVNNGKITRLRRRPAAAEHPHRGHDRPLLSTASKLPDEQIDGKIWNAGYENHSVMRHRRDRARQRRSARRRDRRRRRPTTTAPTTSRRRRSSASSASRRSTRSTTRSRDLSAAFGAGKIPNSHDRPTYYNIKRCRHQSGGNMIARPAPNRDSPASRAQACAALVVEHVASQPARRISARRCRASIIVAGGVLARAAHRPEAARRSAAATASSSARATRRRRSTRCWPSAASFPRTAGRPYGKDGGVLAEHPGPHCVPGVEAATGSLGHGLPIGMRHGAGRRGSRAATTASSRC